MKASKLTEEKVLQMTEEIFDSWFFSTDLLDEKLRYHVFMNKGNLIGQIQKAINKHYLVKASKKMIRGVLQKSLEQSGLKLQRALILTKTHTS